MDDKQCFLNHPEKPAFQRDQNHANSFLNKQKDTLAIGYHDVDLVVAIEVLREELRPHSRLIVYLVGNELGGLAFAGLDIEPVKLTGLS